ncbi:hypothetical protein GU926_07795 [Nibribacter ruber]|uniref:WD40 repeat domain-containing protein n=1 Tax=Nibribacter ruber TaxID=2698458 RepID=A0A6P1NWA3_9BACT|nr:hypothetical protein [Nibribacter ruber]QHL87340.1 hypothetical protein GU926_07795 [Nibribacter ruber]
MLCCIVITFSTLANGPEKGKRLSARQSFRIELPRNSFDYRHAVLPLQDSAFLLITSKRDVAIGKNEILFTKYNHQLTSVWETKAPQPNGTRLLFKAEEKDRAYLLYSTSNSDTKLYLYKIDTQTGSFLLTEHFLHSPYVSVRDMQVLDGQVFLSALDEGDLSILLLNPKEPEVKILPAVVGKAKNLGEFRVDTLNKSLELSVTETQGITTRLQTRFISTKGEIAGGYYINPKGMPIPGQVLRPARISPGLASQKLFLGVYGHKTDEFVQGLYSINLQGVMRYFDLGKLSHFYEYRSSPAAALRMKARALKQEAKGNAPIKQYRMLLHAVQPHPQGYALIGELYEPSVKVDSHTEASGFLLQGTTTTRKTTITFQHQHAFVCVFDFEGNLLWDNSFKLYDYKRLSMGPGVSTVITPEGHMIMAYLRKGEIFYKHLQPNSTTIESVPVQLPAATDKRVTSSQEDLQHWYGNKFLAYGFQRIRSEKDGGRTVFYLQQVTFE